LIPANFAGHAEFCVNLEVHHSANEPPAFAGRDARLTPGLESGVPGRPLLAERLESLSGSEPEDGRQKEIIQWAWRMRLPGTSPLGRLRAE
jgi:hypothetical protein